jgi:hypothetical protein
MDNTSGHTFHIPVMGLAYSIDTPVKVARFGISSVVSIIQDVLIEQMREYHCKETGEEYTFIPKENIDHRALRFTAYLDLLDRIVKKQIKEMRLQPFEEGNDIVKYFNLLPNGSDAKNMYLKMLETSGKEKIELQEQLRQKIVPGDIDVNIMTKLDNINYTKKKEPLPDEYRDSLSALRGFANSTLTSGMVFSAGLNPRLFAYIAQFPDFFPDENGYIKKKIILKVSDYRSAFIQGKFLAKKGLWVTEFRVESGLNCGGHAFPTNGLLVGPILEEFKIKKEELNSELLSMCNKALKESDRPTIPESTSVHITYQGGIGTVKEDQFLREYYNLDRTGWGESVFTVT